MLLLHCALTGKAQGAYSSLTLSVLTMKLLRQPSCVPMSWSLRPKGSCRKDEKQTFVELSRETEILFNRRYSSLKGETKEQLQQLILLERFRNGVPETVSKCLSVHRVAKVEEAAV